MEFMDTERGPGNWPVDERLAFIECREKLDKARKEAAHWRDNHKRAMAEVERLRLEIERIQADGSADQGRPSA
jgi:predicted nuclease with TOPRIM domain